MAHLPARTRRLALVALTTASALAVAACGGGDSGDGGDEPLTVWIVEDLPDRVSATQEIVDDFTARSGTEVELVAVAEDQFNQVLTSGAAAGDLPDVVGSVPLGQLRLLSSNDLVDTDAVGAVVEQLDPATFTESSLRLTTDDGEHLGVPSESWVQLLLYRTDLFEQAGLEPPTTYDAVLAAAAALDEDDRAGFVGAAAAGDAFTAQTFEEVALGNGCELVDDAGEVTLDSPPCVEALDFYGELISTYSVEGTQDVDTTRANYFAGQAAMTIWSSFVLDELAGLRADAAPTCPECRRDPRFLAESSGVVTSLQGPSGSEPATFGEITSWTVMSDAPTQAATAFVEHVMTRGYEPWIAIAPEGKIPVRTGSSPGGTEHLDAWTRMEVGTDDRAPLSDVYGADVLDALVAGSESLSRWALPQGQGTLLGAIQGQQPVAGAVNRVASGTSPEDALAEAADVVRSVAD